jgi:methionine-rich copper-binding protein CopC
MSGPGFRATALGTGGAIALIAAVLAGPAVPALAHNTVIGESPKAGSTVTMQPESVAIETSDALLDAEGATVMDVLGPDGRHYATSCPSVDGAIASVPAELGPAGDYTVEWRVVSADGHPITGEFAFTWTPADGESLADGADAAACAASVESDAPGDAVSEEDEGDADAAASGGLGDLLWVVGGGLAVVVAGIAAFLLTRRRPATAEDAPGADPDGGDVDQEHPGDR